MNTLPLPGRERSVTLPPINAARRLAIARPRPMPSLGPVAVVLSRWNSSNTRSARSGATPTPVSATTTPISPRRRRAPSSTPPLRVNLNALAIRLRSASSTSVRSATTLAPVGTTRNSSRRSRAVALKPGRKRGEQFGERHRREIRLDEARVDLRDVEQRVDHRPKRAQRTVDIAHQFGRFAPAQPARQRADEQRHRVQRLAQVVARGGEEARFGANRLDRLVARGLHLRLERALPGDVEQQHEAAENAAVGVVVGIGEAAHDVDHAAGEIDRRLEFGVRPGERALDVGARAAANSRSASPRRRLR